ncbi:hypothetical protein [Xanthomonas vesicatoria]|uniref:hypothetical protein n=1 Tax=Xanthomonas vesicatoria TaxID=56460 RepID=UPI000731F38D|nr:hypothetical protein [Xanthomonas vesicatoria]KTF37257.1 hypothetical protein LMG919_07980 [Xanthomonas vesicatoria]MCC8558014.1 hypothetical protein [Xanthomonas vesicatoria]MCC8599569.1 hypothetical protein [Xanthomonas vesicatoria]MCC8609500.1 hypothetical protein [Xanthomonas vesicatoria]MCC8675464.1 hypothetical protein [Xanthomonas vesicatoria]
MLYAGRQESKAGDLIEIDGQYRGKVVACMDTDDYLPGHESWSCLGHGIMVDTDFGGLVHYDQVSADAEGLLLIARLPGS